MKNKINHLKSYWRFKLNDIVFIYFIPAMARAYLLLYILPLLPRLRRQKLLMAAHRYRKSAFAERIIKKNIYALAGSATAMMPLQPEKEQAYSRDRFIVLKNPLFHDGGVVEKGVILIKFTNTFAYFAQQIDCRHLLDYFQIVLEPSWSGYCLPEVHFWNQFADQKIIIESSEPNDFSYIKMLDSNLVPVDFGSSDWVDDRIFFPIKNQLKEYDAIFVANYNVIKRPHVLFKAIGQINDPAYNVALVFSKWGPHKQHVHNLIEYFGIGEAVTVFEDLSQTEINELTNRSKVNVLLSLKEGSNRCIFEGFFSNTPGIVLANNIGVNKNYINDKTGRLILDKELASALIHFQKNWRQYKPREWALKNISPHVTTQKLSALLKSIAMQDNGIWTQDIVTKVNAPEAVYYNADNAARFLSPETIRGIFSLSSQNNSTTIVRQLKAALDVLTP